MKLYFNPQSRAVIAKWILDECGVLCEVVPIDFTTREHKTPEFLKIIRRESSRHWSSLFTSPQGNDCLTFEFSAQYAPLTDGFVFSQPLSTVALMDLSLRERAT